MHDTANPSGRFRNLAGSRQQKRPRASSTGAFLAETAGFEPANGLPRYHLSRVAH